MHGDEKGVRLSNRTHVSFGVLPLFNILVSLIGEDLNRAPGDGSLSRCSSQRGREHKKRPSYGARVKIISKLNI